MFILEWRNKMVHLSEKIIFRYLTTSGIYDVSHFNDGAYKGKESLAQKSKTVLKIQHFKIH